MKHAVFLVAALLTMAGCSGAPADVTDGTEEDLTTSFTYQCHLVHHSVDSIRLRVSKTKSKLTVIDTQEFSAGLDGTYTYNPNYKPRATQFAGRAEYNHPLDNTVIIMEQEVRTGGYALHVGGNGGFVTLEGGHIPRTRADFICVR